MGLTAFVPLGGGDTDIVTVTVLADNDPPTARPQAHLSIADEGTRGTLDGSASTDPEGEALTYQWAAPPGITLSSNTAEMPSFTVPAFMANKELVFSLVVTDVGSGVGLSSASASVTVTVGSNLVNDPPTVSVNPVEQSVREFEHRRTALVTLRGQGADPEDEALTYEWTQPAGQTIPLTHADKTSTKAFFLAPNLTASAAYHFFLTARDASGNTSAPATARVEIFAVDEPPVAVAVYRVVGGDFTGAGAVVEFSAQFSRDPEGLPLTYQWTQTAGPPVMFDPTARSFSFTVPPLTAPTEFGFRLQVTDPGGNTDSHSVVFEALLTDPRPQVTEISATPNSVNEGETVTLNGLATGEAPLTYRWQSLVWSPDTPG